MTRYHIFSRTWWKKNKNWEGGREPHLGKKKTIGYADSIEEAIKMCVDHNRMIIEGPLGHKVEFESV